MKPKLLVLPILLAFHLVAMGQNDKEIGCGTGISYRLLSIRKLSDKEKNGFPDVIGYQIAIKLELRNEGDNELEYLSSTVEPRPLGYRWKRRIHMPDWEYLPRSRGKDGPAGSELNGVGYEWRPLDGLESVEAEFFSHESTTEEFKFSTFVRKSGMAKMCEIESGVFKPLITTK